MKQSDEYGIGATDPIDQSTQFAATRRQVIFGACAAIACSANSFAAVIERLPFDDTREPYRVIYDDRYAAGKIFARSAVYRGWQVRAIRGDPTNIWYNELSLRWKVEPATVIGLTQQDSLFVLEHLAWDAGLRVTERHVDAGRSLVTWKIAKSPKLSRRTLA